MANNENEFCDGVCEHPITINSVKTDLISDSKAQQVAELFKMFGDTTRVKILQALSKQEMCVCDLAAVIEMSQSTVSHQLRLLRNSRLVKYRRDGQNSWYSLYDEHIAILLNQGIEHIQH